MSNLFAYNSGGLVPNALQFGTIAMDVNNTVNRSSSNWCPDYGICNQYIIVTDSYTNGKTTQVNAVPMGFKTTALSDSSLIISINKLAASKSSGPFATLTNAITWAISEGYFIVDQLYPPIITSGCVLNLDAGLPASYPLVLSNWYDLSGNGNTGSLSGATYSSSSYGILLFASSGSTYISFASTSNIPSGNANYTISTWFNPSSLGTKGLVGWGNYGTTNQSNSFRLSATGLVNSWGSNDLSVTTSLSTGTWYNAVATFNGTTRQIWVNGSSVGSDTPTSHNVTTTSNLTVGRTNTSEYFDGYIGEVQIFNRALTSNEIVTNYNALLPRYNGTYSDPCNPAPNCTPTQTSTKTPTPTQTSTKTPTPTNTPTNTPTPTVTPTNINLYNCDLCVGSGWISYDATSCYKITTTGATAPAITINLAPSEYFVYSSFGSQFMAPGYNLNGIGTVQVQLGTPIVGGTYTGTLWGNANTTDVDGPLNRCALWTNPYGYDPLNTWIGFSACLSGITRQKTYYVGIGADNEFRLVLDGTEIVNTIGNVWTDEQFKWWHVYPVVIGVGNHTLELYGLNNETEAGFGCEIYDNTLEELTGFTSYSQLNVIFTSSGKTEAIIVQNVDGVYLSSGYTCPSGYVYSTCSGTCIDYQYCDNTPITPTPTPTKTPTNTPTRTPTNTPTRTQTPSITPTRTPTNTPTRTQTPSITPTNTQTPTLTKTPTPTPTSAAVATFTGDFTLCVQAGSTADYRAQDGSATTGHFTTTSTITANNCSGPVNVSGTLTSAQGSLIILVPSVPTGNTGVIVAQGIGATNATITTSVVSGILRIIITPNSYPSTVTLNGTLTVTFP